MRAQSRTTFWIAGVALVTLVIIGDLVVRLAGAAAALQAQTPLGTSFIGLFLAFSEFTVAAVFAAFSLFVPGTRWARLWAVYHFISGVSATFTRICKTSSPERRAPLARSRTPRSWSSCRIW